MSERIRFHAIIAGIEQSGKSYFSIQIANTYPGGVIAYNPGNEKDYKNYKEIEVVEVAERAGMLTKAERRAFLASPKVEYFRHNGEVYHFRQLVSAFPAGRFLLYRIPCRKTEDLFFQALNIYVHNYLIILDDARPVFRQGLQRGAIQFMNRKNHAGKLAKRPPAKGQKWGLDVIPIFHNADKVNGELYDYATHLVLFRSTQTPRPDTIDNAEVYAEITAAIEAVNNAEKYTRAEIPLRPPGYLETQLIGPDGKARPLQKNLNLFTQKK